HINLASRATAARDVVEAWLRDHLRIGAGSHVAHHEASIQHTRRLCSQASDVIDMLNRTLHGHRA
ncbi:MAG: hypothetical protein ABI196_06080, partial [Bradyrhizobium sp.]